MYKVLLGFFFTFAMTTFIACDDGSSTSPSNQEQPESDITSSSSGNNGSGNSGKASSSSVGDIASEFITKNEALGAIIKKMASLADIQYVQTKSDGTSNFMIGTTEYAVQLGNLIDTEAEIAKMEAELKHLQGFLVGVQKKLSNERFVANAPAQVVELERKKQSDAETKIAALTESIAKLKK